VSRTISRSRVTAAALARVRELAPPAWAGALPSERFTLVTARVADVPDLTPPQFERQTFDAYAHIAEKFSKTPCRHPIRFWNHVPFITDPADAGRDNYMVFNAGRFRAFSDWFGGAARFERDVATASATGHWGRDLVIHCLAADAPGHAVNNPRQVAPYHYSQRFGPLPPCFARATRLVDDAAGDLLLVGGTASVRGEDSVHIDDLGAQIRETFVNLAALIGAAIDRKLTPGTKLDRWLGAFREVRVYYANHDHAAEIESAVREHFGGLRRMEFLHADLCRADLLVEIEGIAELADLKR
jgi:chorismate lyase/3-hydroxybenzoate synthase